jgi:Peptidase family M23
MGNVLGERDAVEKTPDAGVRPGLVLPIWVWVASFAAAGSAPGFMGDAMWSAAAAGIGALVGLGLGIAFWVVRRARATGASASRVHDLATIALRGASLGFVAWLFSLLAWLALEMALGGRIPQILQGFVGAAVGAILGRVAAWASIPQANWRRKRRRRCLAGSATFVVLMLAVLYLQMTGPRDLARYPDAHDSPYRLPWPGGMTRLCVQSNRAIVSHRGREEFAYDFAMPVGSEVSAARGGIVIRVEVEHDGRGLDAPNNSIVIDHADGTFGWYLHLRQGGSNVAPGRRVRQGEHIAASGNVGMSSLPHLHFQVTDAAGHLLPVTFADVGSDAGIPRMFKRYTSGNTLVDESGAGQ